MAPPSHASAKLRSRGGVCQALWNMRRFVLAAIMFEAFDIATIDVLTAFLYSTVECPQVAPTSEGTCPVGSFLAADTCEPEPPQSHHWSMSALCADKHEVMLKTTHLKGYLHDLQHGAALLAALVAGPLIDTVGRKPMLLTALGFQVVYCLMLFLACVVGQQMKALYVTFVGLAFVCAGCSLSIFHPTSAAMVADLSGDCTATRGDGYAALSVVVNISVFVGYGSAFPLLKAHLENYLPVWAAAVGIGAAAMLASGLVLKETMPDAAAPSPSNRPQRAATVVSVQSSDTDGTGPSSKTGRSVARSIPRTVSHVSYKAARETVNGFQCVWRDRFLLHFVILFGFVTVASVSILHLLNAYQVSVLGYDNATASLCGIVLPVVGIISSVLTSVFIRKCGVYGLLVVQFLVVVVGFLAAGALAANPHWAPAGFWFGLALFAIGWSSVQACSRTIISMHVPTDRQGSVFAILQVVSGLLSMTVGLLWPEVFFHPGAKGWRTGAIWIASGAVVFFCTIWFAFLMIACPSPADSADAAFCGVNVSQNEVSREASISSETTTDSGSDSGSSDEVVHEDSQARV